MSLKLQEYHSALKPIGDVMYITTDLSYLPGNPGDSRVQPLSPGLPIYRLLSSGFHDDPLLIRHIAKVTFLKMTRKKAKTVPGGPMEVLYVLLYLFSYTALSW